MSVKPGDALIAKLPKGRGASIDIVFADGQSLRETVEFPKETRNARSPVRPSNANS
jgi:hypothetical protein